jgi:regulator of protease activity HflC (stomatin/prohibitin superfamily)
MGDLLTSYGVLIFLAAVLIFTGLFTVRQQTAYIIERFGKFHSIRQAGLQFKIPFLDKVSGKLNLKI